MFGVIIAIGYQNIIQLKDDDLGKYLILIATISYGFAGVWGKLRLQNLTPVFAATGMLTMSTIILSPYAFTVHLEEIYSLNLFIRISLFLEEPSIVSEYIFSFNFFSSFSDSFT